MSGFVETIAELPPSGLGIVFVFAEPSNLKLQCTGKSTVYRVEIGAPPGTPRTLPPVIDVT